MLNMTSFAYERSYEYDSESSFSFFGFVLYTNRQANQCHAQNVGCLQR